MNEDGAELPVRETALSLAALADNQKPPLNQIGDARMGPTGQDGKQIIYIGNDALDNPATRAVGSE